MAFPPVGFDKRIGIHADASRLPAMDLGPIIADGVARDDAFLVALDDLLRPLDQPEDLTAAGARLLGEHLRADACIYGDVDADEDAFTVLGDCTGASGVVGRHRFGDYGDECRRLLRAGASCVVTNTEADARTAAVRSAYRAIRVRAVIWVPVLKAGRFVAAMGVQQHSPREWTADEVALVGRVAARCWESIARARIARELRASNQRLRTALETARQVAWEWVPGGATVRCAHTANAVLGLTLDDGFVAAAAWDACIHPDDRAGRRERIADAERSRAPYHAEFRWRRPDDGAQVWVEEFGRIDAAPAGPVRLINGTLADITARKTAEIERARFFTLGLDLMVVASFDGHLQRVSPAWERALGWSEAELTARPWLDFIHPDDHAASIREGEKLFAGHDTAAFENRWRARDGSWRWLSWKLKTFPDERLLYGAAIDISERKNREARDAFLIALDDAIRTVTDPADIMRIASDRLGRHLHADRCVYGALDADGDTFVITVHAMRPGLTEMGGRVSFRSFGAALRRRFEANQPSVFADVLTDPDSADVRDEYMRHGIRSHLSVPLIKDGRIIAVWGLHHQSPRAWHADDIDLLRRVADRCWESMERARALAAMRQTWQLFDSALSHTPDFTYIFDCDGRFIYINRALLALWQKSFAEAVGKNFFELGYPPDLAGRLQQQIRDVIASGARVRDHTPFTGPTGETRHYEYIFVPVFADDGAVTGVAGSTRDITDRLRAEADLRQANDQLARSNRELEQFAYMASHDLQEPLRMVASFVHLLERRSAADLDDAARSYIARAKDGTARMQSLIRDLLTYARLGEPRPAAPVDLGRVLAIALDHLTVRIADAAADITGDALPTVPGVELQLVQLFQNLISNAIKFRDPARPPRVHLSARDHGGQWTIIVADNGIGVPADQRQRIFEVFYRAHHDAAYEGTGIGLAICKKIAESHGGSIDLESEVGVGSRFIVRLPKAS